MLEGVLPWLSSWDALFLVWINNFLSHPLLDKIFPVITILGSVWFWVPASLLIMWRKRLLGGRLVAGLIGTTALLLFLKGLFARARPYEVLQGLHVLDREPFASFPSAHAANAFMAAYLLAEAYPKYSDYFYILAALVALSRLYLGVHYPLDVLGGALVGMVIGWTVVKRITKDRKK